MFFKYCLILINFYSRNYNEFELILHEESKLNRWSFMNLLYIKSNIIYELSWLSILILMNICYNQILIITQRLKN